MWCCSGYSKEKRKNYEMFKMWKRKCNCSNGVGNITKEEKWLSVLVNYRVVA